MNEINALLYPEQNKFLDAAKTITKALVNKYNQGLGKALQAIEIGASIPKIISLVDEFCEKFFTKILEFRTELPTLELLLKKEIMGKVTDKEIHDIYTKLIDDKIVTKEGKVLLSQEELSIRLICLNISLY